MKDVNFDALFEAYLSQVPVMVQVLEKQETGFKVDLFGMEAFLPGSETVDKNVVREGDEIDVQIVKMSPGRNNVVVSNRAAVSGRLEKDREAMLDTLEVGQILSGRVKSIADYGVFVSVGPVDGLVYIHDVSWDRFADINEVIREGDDVKVKVISITEKKGKRLLSLSIKDATDNPWDVAKIEDYVDSIVEGEIISVSNYGAFVKVGQFQALLHKSEISWGKVIDPRDVLAKGQKITAKVVSMNIEKRQMALSMKAIQSEQWSLYVSEDIIGKSYMVKVTDIVASGLKVELFPNIYPLLHKIALPKDIRKLPNFGGRYSVGNMIPVKVKSVNDLTRKIILELSTEEEARQSIMAVESASQQIVMEQSILEDNNAAGTVQPQIQTVPAPATQKQIELADFLYKFTEDDGFKFLTHDIKTAGINLIEYIALCKRRLLDWKKEHQDIPEDLYQLIRGFIFGKRWTGCDGEDHTVYCSSYDWVNSYHDNNGEHPMNSDQFRDEVDIFRNSIRWRNGKLENYLITLREKYPLLDIEIDKSVKGADFYTYTRNIRLAIEEILSSMQDFAEGHNRVQIRFYQEDLSNGYFRAVLTFEQEGSFPSHDFERDRRKLDSGGGTMGNIRKALKGYADWAVESRWLDQEIPSRWTILGETVGLQSISSANGFKHIISIVHRESNI